METVAQDVQAPPGVNLPPGSLLVEDESEEVRLARPLPGH